MTLNIQRLVDFEPSWSGRTLHLTVRPEALRRGEARLTLSPTELTVNGEVLPCTVAHLEGRTRRDSRSEIFLVLGTEEHRVELPCRSDPYLGELERVLAAWATRDEIRQAWGTDALGALLIPEITADTQRRLRMLDRLEGRAIPVLGGGILDRLKGLFQSDHQRLFFTDDALVLRGERIPYASITASWGAHEGWVIQAAGKTHRIATYVFSAHVDLAALVVHLAGLAPGAWGAELTRLMPPTPEL